MLLTIRENIQYTIVEIPVASEMEMKVMVSATKLA